MSKTCPNCRRITAYLKLRVKSAGYQLGAMEHGYIRGKDSPPEIEIMTATAAKRYAFWEFLLSLVESEKGTKCRKKPSRKRK